MTKLYNCLKVVLEKALSKYTKEFFLYKPTRCSIKSVKIIELDEYFMFVEALAW